MATHERLEAYHFYEQDWDDMAALREWFEWEVPETFNMASYVCDRWADDRGRVAMFFDTAAGERETYTYWQLDRLSNRLANYLRSEGIERGDRVGVNMPQRPETVIAHVAAWKLGAVSVPLSTLFGPDALSYRLDDSGAKAAVADPTNLDTLRSVQADLPDLETTVTVDAPNVRPEETRIATIFQDADPTFETVDTDPEEDAILIYTSGTTGSPKGVLHAHRLLLGHLPGFLTAGNLNLDDGSVYWTPGEWAWIASLFNIVFPAMFYGRPVVASNTDGPFDPEHAFELLEEYGITMGFVPPTALRMMRQVDDPDRFDTDSLGVIASGGEAVGKDVVNWVEGTFGGVIHEGYGQTEANIVLTECGALGMTDPESMGVAPPGHEVTIVDPETAEPTVPNGEVGEIAVRYAGDPVCFKEYWNKPEKTERKVRNGWLLTEDLGWQDDEGYFYFKSRKDDVIISAGYRIGPEEVEESISDHDAVVDAGVVGVPDEERGEIPKAFVVLADGYEATDDLREELAQYVKDNLAAYEYPREIEFVESLPRTTTGKVRRSALQEDDEVA
ncbi:MAG: acyl-CoA synthetase [Halodesulfurarchaeum sp.]